MAWITPKTDWLPVDGIDNGDLNRIEGDITFIGSNPTGTALRLAPAGGNILIGKDTDDTADKLQVAGGISATILFMSSVDIFQGNNPSQDTLYDLISPMIPAVGNKCIISGSRYVSTSDPFIYSHAYRTTADTIFISGLDFSGSVVDHICVNGSATGKAGNWSISVGPRIG